MFEDGHGSVPSVTSQVSLLEKSCFVRGRRAEVGRRGRTGERQEFANQVGKGIGYSSGSEGNVGKGFTWQEGLPLPFHLIVLNQCSLSNFNHWETPLFLGNTQWSVKESTAWNL